MTTPGLERHSPVVRPSHLELSRRSWLASLPACPLLASSAAAAPDAVDVPYRQSMAAWCFERHWSLKEMAQVARRLGLHSVELVPPQHWKTLLEHGLICALAPIDLSPYPPFVKGPNNPRYQEEVLAALRKSIDACAEAGFPNVIAFTGYKYWDVDQPQKGEIPLDEGIKNCVQAFKKLVGYAERKKVTICLEMLNTRDSTHPMKGHPGYHGDHLDICVEIVQKVGSARLKLLFDIYHVQIMDGDLIRRIGQLRDLIAHVHTAGNPGRGELGPDQEINYRAVMKALADVGYSGFIGHEFLPTKDPLIGLRQAVGICRLQGNS
jgi:sugar phosphate isomerase/epimerase